MARLGVIDGPFCKSFLGSASTEVRKICENLQASANISRQAVEGSEKVVAEKSQDPQLRSAERDSIADLAVRLYMATHRLVTEQYEGILRSNNKMVPPDDRCETCPLKGIVIDGQVTTNEVGCAQARLAITATQHHSNLEA